jgi:tight adherence protein B
MRAGRSFVGAIAVVADTSAEPMKGELERALTDERLGLPIEDTLEAIARRMDAPDMEQIALIAALNRNSGSNVAEALERVAGSARERADLAREMRSLTGQARMTSWVLSALPPAMLVTLSLVAPSYAHPLLHTTLGIVLLVIATLMVVAGWAVMTRIVNPEV